MDTKLFPRYFQTREEAGAFALLVSGENQFKCNIQSRSCDKKPTCESVIRHLEKEKPDLEPEKLMEDARKSYWALETIIAVTTVASDSFVSIYSRSANR